MIVFIPRSAGGSKPLDEDKVGFEWLPEICPACGQGRLIGHGRRERSAHDKNHHRIQVRRGLCKICRKTFTILPAWCIPGAIYTLDARQQAMARLAANLPTDQAAPDCRDSTRFADTSAIRRWFWRRIAGLRFFLSPTLYAWDFWTAARILVAEGFSP